MKLDPLIHIGFGKTGTTWFQKNYYPKLNEVTYLKRPKVFKFLDYIHESNFDLKIAKSILINGSNERIVICEENILKGDLIKIEHTAKILKEIISNGKIIIFIRNQIDMIASRYMQYVKGGGTYSINRFLWGEEIMHPFNEPNFIRRFHKLQYHKVIEIYIKHFSKKNVFIFLFEDFQACNKTFIDHYSKLFSFTASNQFKFRKRNVSYRKGLLSIAIFTNHFSKHSRKRKSYYFHIPLLLTLSRNVFALLNNLSIFGKQLSSHEILGEKNINFISKYFRDSNNILLDSYRLENIIKYKYPL